MAKWVAKKGIFDFEIKGSDNDFDVTVRFLTYKDCTWFTSYASARNFLRREYDFRGRMKKVGE